MFKKVIIVLSLLTFSSLSVAASCFESDLRTYRHENELEPRWELSVKSKVNVYMYSAPLNICKMDETYIIENDHVIAYSLFKDKAHEEWVYVMYTNTNHDEEDGDDLIEGWVKLKDFQKLDNYVSVKQ